MIYDVFYKQIFCQFSTFWSNVFFYSDFPRARSKLVSEASNKIKCFSFFSDFILILLESSETYKKIIKIGSKVNFLSKNLQSQKLKMKNQFNGKNQIISDFFLHTFILEQQKRLANFLRGGKVCMTLSRTGLAIALPPYKSLALCPRKALLFMTHFSLTGKTATITLRNGGTPRRYGAPLKPLHYHTTLAY